MARLIERTFRVAYHPEHVRKILKRRLGWTSQKPRRKARERNDKEVARWVGDEFPRIVREAFARRAYLVFLDESGAQTNLARRRGRAPEGERLVASTPHGHWKTTTFVAALRSEGLVAPMVIDGAMNGDLFVAYAQQVLVPSLRAGDIVVLDNLASHKRVAAVRAVERAGGTVVYLPPYSPDYNPIELAFAKIKARLRAAELRTIDRVENFFGTVHDDFTTDECHNYIRHAGYTATP